MNYVQLYHDLLEHLPSGTIQELMETAYHHVHLPILATDVTYQLLGIYPRVKSGKPYWDLLLEKGKYDTQTIMELYEDGILQSADQNERPYLVDWGRAAKEEPKIVALIKVNGHTEGFISLLCEKEQWNDDISGAVEIIAKICSILYQEKRSQSNIAKLQPKAFANELLRGKITTKEQLHQWQQNTDFYPQASYQLLAIQGEGQSVERVFTNFCAKLERIVPSQLSLIRNQILYVLFYDLSMAASSQHMREIKSLLTGFHLKVGCSVSFSDLLYCREHMEQAIDALKAGKKLDPQLCLYDYPSYALYSLIETGSSHTSIYNATHPMLLMLKEYDAKHHSELYDTLACYIRFMGQSAKIIEELHIHRNSLPYRIHKIETITGYSLQDFETVLHVSINFYLMEQKEEA